MEIDEQPVTCTTCDNPDCRFREAYKRKRGGVSLRRVCNKDNCNKKFTHRLRIPPKAL